MSDVTDVEIGEIVARVRLVDGDSLLAPSTLARIVQAVLAAMNDRESHRERVRAERRVTGGVAYEQEEAE